MTYRNQVRRNYAAREAREANKREKSPSAIRYKYAALFEAVVAREFAIGEGDKVLKKTWPQGTGWLPSVMDNDITPPLDYEDPNIKERYEQFVVPLIHKLEQLAASDIKPDVYIETHYKGEPYTNVQEFIPAFFFHSMRWSRSRVLLLQTRYPSATDRSAGEYYYDEHRDFWHNEGVIITKTDELRFKYARMYPRYYETIDFEEKFGEPVVGNINFLAELDQEKLEALSREIDQLLNPTESEDED